MMKLHNTIIYFIGIPAVGKYTVAKEIGRITGAKVVDNQLILEHVQGTDHGGRSATNDTVRDGADPKTP